MKLNEYLKKNDETVSHFALRCGVPQPTIWRIVKNRHSPSLEIADKIIDATSGLVTFRDLIKRKAS